MRLRTLVDLTAGADRGSDDREHLLHPDYSATDLTDVRILTAQARALRSDDLRCVVNPSMRLGVLRVTAKGRAASYLCTQCTSSAAAADLVLDHVFSSHTKILCQTEDFR